MLGLESSNPIGPPDLQTGGRIDLSLWGERIPLQSHILSHTLLNHAQNTDKYLYMYMYMFVYMCIYVYIHI